MDRAESERMTALLDRFARTRQRADRDAAVEALVPWARRIVRVHVSRRGLYGLVAEETEADALYGLLCAVESYRRQPRVRSGIAWLHHRVTAALIEGARTRLGRTGSNRARLRARLVPIETADLRQVPDRSLLKIEQLDQAAEGLRRIRSPRLRAILTLQAAGWTPEQIGLALGVTSRRIHHLASQGRRAAVK